MIPQGHRSDRMIRPAAWRGPGRRPLGRRRKKRCGRGASSRGRSVRMPEADPRRPSAATLRSCSHTLHRCIRKQAWGSDLRGGEIGRRRSSMIGDARPRARDAGPVASHETGAARRADHWHGFAPDPLILRHAVFLGRRRLRDGHAATILTADCSLSGVPTHAHPQTIDSTQAGARESFGL